MSWIDDIVSPKARKWEEFYRNRFQHDKIVRSTHGVNCTGSCSWNVCVKDGIVTWELQAVDYPIINTEIPPYEPRGCQRGISFSWYLYSPIRIKYPYVRGALLDIWAEAKRKTSDPVEAWKSIQENPSARKRYQKARGKGGFRRASWDEMLELIAASNIYTIKTHGPDRVTGFSPIPAMSQISYAAGARFLQLIGGVCLSFYDWYCDLPPSSPETWGEQTDVGESADWYNSKMIAIMGANLNMTRTPDCHFIPEARMNGTKVVTFSPDFNQVAKFGDEWVPVHAGQDGAFWMSVVHVIMKEFHHDSETPYFMDYQKKYTDNPFLIEIDQAGNSNKPGRFFRAGKVEAYSKEEHSDWKFLVYDEDSKSVKMPKGTMGHRWQEKKGQWNLELKDTLDDSPINPSLTLLKENDEVLQVEFTEFGLDKKFQRGVPVRYIETTDGKKTAVTTVYDLLMAQYGVGRGLAGDYPSDYNDVAQSYTPAWQERFTGIGKETVINFARDWARTAAATDGKCSVIIGAGIDHWYHNNLIYRAAQNALILCGCVGKNGGGLNHYVGQEKLAPAAPWGAIAFAKDWQAPVRLQNAPSWHYMHTDQWRYDSDYNEINSSPEEHPISKGHTADLNAKAVRNGWLPFYPQYKDNPLNLCKEAQAGGASNDAEIKDYVFKKVINKEITPAIEDIDAPESFPRVWYIWRGNAIGTSAKGHEYFLSHYLGTHTNKIAPEVAKDSVKEIKWYEEAPVGKMDLVVDINFRMDTSALYSDIVLPAASWYEKFDLNTTDMHSFIHPLAAAIPPVWESKSDWDTFKCIARVTSEMAKSHFTGPVKDIVNIPLQHDTIDELSQPNIKDWAKGECEPVLGKSMYKMVVTERDYTKIYDKFCSFGPNVRKGLGAHGVKYPIEDFYEQRLKDSPTHEFDGETYPSLEEDIDVCNTILHFAAETNGELAHRAYEGMEKVTGLKLTDISEKNRSIRMNFKDIQASPKRLHSSPIWSGLLDEGRTYSAYTYNIDKMVPWRTLTGRQSLYLDHEGYIAFGENLPTYKPSPSPEAYGDLRVTKEDDKCLRLNYLTPHGKWHIHSTYGDTHRMLTLSRGGEPFWMSPEDAAKLDIKDNEYVEVYNDNGVVVTRANVSARIPPGVCIVYHATERTYGTPKSPGRGNKRAGMNNSLTRVHLKPNLMMGGYAQFTYHFNYWGPTGVNRDTHILVRKLDKVDW